MRWPRMTTRRWMVVVAVVALGMYVDSLGRRSMMYRRMAAHHYEQSIVYEFVDGSWQMAKWFDAQKSYHLFLEAKYKRAAIEPWRPLEPDPPPPDDEFVPPPPGRR